MFDKIAHIADRYLDFVFGFVSVTIYLSLCGVLALAGKPMLSMVFIWALVALAVAAAFILIISAFKRRKAA